MSKNSSVGSTPVHTGSPFDLYYDPEFTAEISARMHVPDKICVVEGLQNSSQDSHHREELRTMMNVPDRIIVAGDNKHFAVRDSVPELKFDRPFPTTQKNYGLDAPPNVLTVDEYPYPSTEFNKPVPKDTKKRSVRDNLDNSSVGMNFNDSSISSAEDEVLMLRKQLLHLSRRVSALEQDGQQRQQREIILYGVGIAYFLCKGIIWLHRHF